MHVFGMVAWLTLHGCSLPGAVGITTNLWVESKLDPVSRGSGLGLAQWVGVRRARMLRSVGRRWRDAEAQLMFLVTEATERGDWAATCSQTSASAATRVWLRRYERGSGLGYRLAAARWVAAQVGGGVR
jgi:hypothetical protein